MKIIETLYGEIVFDSEGYAIGAIWMRLGITYTNFMYRTKSFKEGNRTTLQETREAALAALRNE